jgi:dTDP-4-amino-4,6-dideoxygalactose transaminase
MFETLNKFENLVSEYFGSKYAVSTDCCTHAIELCLRLLNSNNVSCPKNTYLSVPMTFKKLGLDWNFENNSWQDFYYIGNSPIIDAAVLWKEKSYISDSFTCLSFQFKKHLSVGRGGMILLDDITAYNSLIKMSYDGRLRHESWATQSIDTIGYHYYMTPETAELGIKKFYEVKDIPSKQWSYLNYPDLSSLPVFAKTA